LIFVPKSYFIRAIREKYEIWNQRDNLKNRMQLIRKMPS